MNNPISLQEISLFSQLSEHSLAEVATRCNLANSRLVRCSFARETLAMS